MPANMSPTPARELAVCALALECSGVRMPVNMSLAPVACADASGGIAALPLAAATGWVLCGRWAPVIAADAAPAKDVVAVAAAAVSLALSVGAVTADGCAPGGGGRSPAVRGSRRGRSVSRIMPSSSVST